MALSGRRKISVIWNHFEDVGDGYASCNICRSRVSYKTSTTNLKRHIERIHDTSIIRGKTPRTRVSVNKVQSPVLDIPSKPSATEPPATPTTPATPSVSFVRTSMFARRRHHTPAVAVADAKHLLFSQKKAIDEALMNLFIKDLQPFSIVEERGFVEYTRALNSLYHLPNKNYLSNVKMPALHNHCHREVRAKMESQARNVCFSLYSWKSRTGEGRVAIMAHYVGVDFQFNSVLLECARFGGEDPSMSCGTVLGRVASDWGLEGKISVAVSDDDMDLKVAVVHELGWPHMFCCARALNSVVQRALHRKEIRKTLEKVRALVAYFKGDREAGEELQRQQHGVASPMGLIGDHPFRWDSTLFMIQRFTQLQDAVMNALDGASDGMHVSPEDWETLSQLGTVLQPFEEVAAQMSRDPYTTASQIFVLTRGLHSLCAKLSASQGYNSRVKAVVSELSEGVGERLWDVEQRPEVAVCTLLDPRFKVHAFPADAEGQAARDRAVESVTSLVREEYRKTGVDLVSQVETGPSPVAGGRLSAWEDFDSVVEEVQPRGTPANMAEKEVHRYLEDKLLGRNEDPFQWWRRNKHVYPNLAKLVPYKCNILATAIPCERVFSRIQNLIDERQAALGEKELQQLLFLYANTSSDNHL